MIGRIISSFKKSRRLRKISQNLSAPLDLSSIDAVLKNQNKKKEATEELLSLCMDDSFNVELMRRYAVSKQDIESIYSNLSLSGAGQWAGGHFVSASSLVYAQTLNYLLRLYKSEDNTDSNKWNTASYRLIEYFRTGETGMVIN